MKKIVSLLIIAVLMVAISVSGFAADDVFSYNADTGRIVGTYESDGNVETWLDGELAAGKTLNVPADEGTHLVQVYENGVLLYEQSVIVCVNHKYEVVSETPATCTGDGSVSYVCSVCGDSYTDIIPALEHTVVVDEAVEPQFGVPGKTEGSHCSVCGTVLVAQEEIPALTEVSCKIDLADVEKTDKKTTGFGHVEYVGDAEVLYARVTWNYTLSSGESYSYVAMKDIKDGSFSMAGNNAPFGATLNDVYVVITEDANADQGGAYTAVTDDAIAIL